MPQAMWELGDQMYICALCCHVRAKVSAVNSWKSCYEKLQRFGLGVNVVWMEIRAMSRASRRPAAGDVEMGAHLIEPFLYPCLFPGYAFSWVLPSRTGLILNHPRICQHRIGNLSFAMTWWAGLLQLYTWCSWNATSQKDRRVFMKILIKVLTKKCELRDSCFFNEENTWPESHLQDISMYSRAF